MIALNILSYNVYCQDNSNSDSLKSSGNLTIHSRKQFRDVNKVNFIKMGLITGVSVGAGWWLHNYQKNAWWSGQRTSFHVQNDWNYSLSADKAGHFFDGAFINSLYSGAFQWAGFKPKAAVWMGAAFSLAYMTDIEIEDGFAKDWGFSPGDE